MRAIIILFLIAGLVISPVLAQQPSQREIQAQMKEAVMH
jgi:hypothetical protein